MSSRKALISLAGALAFALVMSAGVQAQVGKSLGVLDANTAPEADLLKMPHMTPAIVKGLIANRNFNSIVALNKYLLGAGLTQAQATEFYGRAFVAVNLNTATPEEFLLVPGSTKRWAHEFEEYRPWTSFAQFDKEIGKYTTPRNDAAVLDKFKQYLFIPLDLNTATDADLMTIPGMTTRMVHEFKEYRPWKTKQQFEKEIGKYVDAKAVERFWRFVVIK
jgi:DNA uptake protein ComE-like DNA-binding protein